MIGLSYCRKAILLSCLVIVGFNTAWANQASIVLFPTRAVLQESDKSVQISLINKGNATGSYIISLVDMDMKENGKIKQNDTGIVPSNSLTPFTRFSPRRVTLAPEQNQKIKILIRKKGNLPDGEYRSHLRVYMIEDNVEAAEQQALLDQSETEASIAVRQRTAFLIPIIWRKGKTEVSFKIQNLSFNIEKNGMKFDTLREGNQSQIGNFAVTHIPDGGSPKLIGQLNGVAVYDPTPKRVIKMRMLEGVKLPLSKGKVIITYVKREDEGGGMLAEYEQLIP